MPRRPPAPPRELGLVFLLALLWGSPYALTKISLTTIPPLTLVAGRVALAAAVLWIVVLLRRLTVPRDWRFMRLLFLQGVLSCVLPYSLITFGQQNVDSSLAAILNSATPIFVCAMSVAWAREESLAPHRIAGVFVGFAGVIGVIGTSALLGLGHELFGQGLIVLATLASAFSVMHGRKFVAVAPEIVAAGMLTAAALAMVPLSLLVERPWTASPSSSSVIALVINALVSTALAFIVYFRLIRTVGSMSTASTSYLKPAVGVLIGCLFLDEALTWPMLAGLAAILAGVWAINSSAPAALPDGTRHAAPASDR